MLHRRILPLVALAATTLALSACGSDLIAGNGYSAQPAPLSAGPSAQDPAGTDAYGYGSGPGANPGGTAPGASPPVLAAREATDVGTIVADAGGFTLYRFDKDSAKPPATTCVADCATKWPPVVVDPKGRLALEGVDRSAVGLVQRPDGTSQLTLGGWPVYRFAGDANPGATEGQGVGGTWYAVTPEGKKAAGAP